MACNKRILLLFGHMRILLPQLFGTVTAQHQAVRFASIIAAVCLRSKYSLSTTIGKIKYGTSLNSSRFLRFPAPKNLHIIVKFPLGEAPIFIF